MKICKKCGAQLPDSAFICSACGEYIDRKPYSSSGAVWRRISLVLVLVTIALWLFTPAFSRMTGWEFFMLLMRQPGRFLRSAWLMPIFFFPIIQLLAIALQLGFYLKTNIGGAKVMALFTFCSYFVLCLFLAFLSPAFTGNPFTDLWDTFVATNWGTWATLLCTAGLYFVSLKAEKAK